MQCVQVLGCCRDQIRVATCRRVALCVVRTSFKSHWAEPYQKPCMFTGFITAFSRISPEMFTWIPLQRAIGHRLRNEIQILNPLQLGVFSKKGLYCLKNQISMKRQIKHETSIHSNLILQTFIIPLPFLGFGSTNVYLLFLNLFYQTAKRFKLPDLWQNLNQNQTTTTKLSARNRSAQASESKLLTLTFESPSQNLRLETVSFKSPSRNRLRVKTVPTPSRLPCLSSHPLVSRSGNGPQRAGTVTVT